MRAQYLAFNDNKDKKATKKKVFHAKHFFVKKKILQNILF